MRLATTAAEDLGSLTYQKEVCFKNHFANFCKFDFKTYTTFFGQGQVLLVLSFPCSQNSGSLSDSSIGVEFQKSSVIFQRIEFLNLPDDLPPKIVINFNFLQSKFNEIILGNFKKFCIHTLVLSELYGFPQISKAWRDQCWPF